MLLQKETIHALAFSRREMPILPLSLSLLLSLPYIIIIIPKHMHKFADG